MPERQRKDRAPKWERKRVGHIAGYLTEREVAEKLGVVLRTLRLWRARGNGKPERIHWLKIRHRR